MSMHSHLPVTDLVPRTLPKVGHAAGISAALLIVGLAGCSGSADTTGIQDVGGHRLYMSCAGDGPTTVVLVHCWGQRCRLPSPRPRHPSARPADRRLPRVPLRPTTDATWGPARPWTQSRRPGDVVREMSAVLKPAARSRRTSCGRARSGTGGSAYLETHPDDVTGGSSSTPCSPTSSGWTATSPRQYTFTHFDREDRCCTEAATLARLSTALSAPADDSGPPRRSTLCTRSPRSGFQWTRPKQGGLRVLDGVRTADVPLS